MKIRDFIAKVDEVQRCLNKQGLFYKIADVCKMAASMSAPRFYIDPITALKQYNKYIHGNSNIHNDTRRKMYAEVFSRYEKKIGILKATGQIIRKIDAMESILNQQAPSFYYEDDSALKMYYYGLSKRKRTRL